MVLQLHRPETKRKDLWSLKMSANQNMSFLHKEPSLSVYTVPNSDGFCEDGKKGQDLERYLTTGDGVDTEFSFQKIEEGVEYQDQVLEEPLSIALGTNLTILDEESDLEEHYKTMIEQCPFHPLFLRNYAQLLQTKGDLYGAEEYYSRASSADPEDSETWMRYAKLVWELHHDKDRASKYFKLATEFAPNDSSVLAAYASFLWEIDDGDEEDDETCQVQVKNKESVSKPNNKKQANVSEGVGTEAPSNPENLEEYYKKTIKDNPNDALCLENYAKFLYKSKGDPKGAEEYYSRAVVADPGNGKVTVSYAKLIWEIHRDAHKASVYFERAVQYCPENSDVLAAYANFLWEIGDDEEEDLTV